MEVVSHKTSRSPEPKPSQSDSKELENYLIENTIDEGSFGKVKLGIHIPTQEKVAIKVLEKSRIVDPDDHERIAREIKFLKRLKHINIIQIYEIIENAKNFYLIMEYVDGGELFGYIAKKKRLDDNDASHLFAQIINGLEHIHKNNIVHRDLKPENLLLTKNKTLKIIDFGLSNNYLPNQLLKTPCGSPSYASPEMILGKKYSGMMVDIWSSGIILFGMVCGYLPFEDRDNEKLYRKVLEGNIIYPDYISEQSKDLISKMLVVDPKKRIKFEEIKSHQYYKKGLSQIKKEEFDFVDKNSLNEMVIEIMAELGYEREEINKSINKRHNKLTTTYSLLFNKFRADPTKFNPKSGIQIEEIMKKASMADLELVEEKLLLSKNIFKANNNKNFVNNNNNYMNRIGKNNIERVSLDKPSMPGKSKSGNATPNINSSDNTFNIDNNVSSPPQEKKDSLNNTKGEDGRREGSSTKVQSDKANKTHSNSISLDLQTIHINLNKESNNCLGSVDPTIKKVEKMKTNQIINSKFNTSMSYDMNLDSTVKSANDSINRLKSNSPPERADINSKKKGLTNRIVSILNKDNEGQNLPVINNKTEPKDDFEQKPKKMNGMDVIFEENEINSKSYKTNTTNFKIDDKQLKSQSIKSNREIKDSKEFNNLNKIDNYFIDFTKSKKPEIKEKSDLNPLKFSTNQTSSKPVRLNSQEKAKGPLLTNIQASPQDRNHKNIVISGSSERKPINLANVITVEKGTKYVSKIFVQTTHSVEKGMPRSISPANFISSRNPEVLSANVSNSKKENNNLVGESPGRQKLSNLNVKNSVNQANTKPLNNIKTTDLKRSNNILTESKKGTHRKENSHGTTSNFGDKKEFGESKKTSSSNFYKIENSMRKEILDKKSKEAKKEKKNSDKISIDLSKTGKKEDFKEIKDKKELGKTTTKMSSNNIKEKDKIDSLMNMKENVKEFACCTICNVEEIQNSIKEYCFNNNIVLKLIGELKYECSKENILVGVEFSRKKDVKCMKIYHISGNETFSKEIMKAFLNLAL